MSLINLFYRIYNISIYLPDVLKFFRIDSILRHFVAWISSSLLPIYFHQTGKRHQILINKQYERERRIIVSLTSFPRRISAVWQTIESLMRQELCPDKIILWLSKEQFSSTEQLPKELQKLCERGLEINFVEKDYRSHKKYLYVFKEYPNDYVVLVDDDILYPTDFLKKLLYGMDESRVHCSYGHLMTHNECGELLPYSLWKKIQTGNTDDKHFFFGSGGGTAFVPSSLYIDVCNINVAYQLCPLADDVWLNAMCRLAKLKLVKVRGELIFPVFIKNDQTLCSTNIYENKNDAQIASIRNYYIKSIGVDPFTI